MVMWYDKVSSKLSKCSQSTRLLHQRPNIIAITGNHDSIIHDNTGITVVLSLQNNTHTDIRMYLA